MPFRLCTPPILEGLGTCFHHLPRYLHLLNRSSIEHAPYLADVCTLMAFLGSMTWMDLAADEVVGVTVALGTIFNFDRSLVRSLASSRGVRSSRSLVADADAGSGISHSSMISHSLPCLVTACGDSCLMGKCSFRPDL